MQHHPHIHFSFIEGSDVKIGAADGRRDAAAQIWAEATAQRDGEHEVATIEEARPVLDRVLQLANSYLMLAWQNAEIAGFAALSKLNHDQSASFEIHYLATAPSKSRQGIARALLENLTVFFKQQNADAAYLKVYEDNHSAVKLYTQAGWEPYGQSTIHPHSHRLEATYCLKL